MPIQTHIHFQCAFDLRSVTKPDQPWAAATHTIRAWIKSRIEVDADFDKGWFFRWGEWQQPSDRGVKVWTASTFQDETNPVPEHWAVRFVHPDRDFPPRVWQTDVGLTSRSPDVLRVNVSVSHSLREGFMGLEPAAPSLSSPRIVRDLLNARYWRPSSGSETLHLAPVRISESTVSDLVARIADPLRECPIVLVSRFVDPVQDITLLSPDALARHVAGIVNVYVAEDRRAQTTVNSELPMYLRCSSGAVRVYRPGCRIDSEYDAARHRFFTSRQIGEVGPTEVEIAIARSLMRRISHTSRDGVATIEDVEHRYRERRFNDMRRQVASRIDDDEVLNMYVKEYEEVQEKCAALESANFELETKSDDLEFRVDSYLDRALAAEKQLAATEEALHTLQGMNRLPASVVSTLETVCALHPTRLAFTRRALESAGRASINSHPGEMPKVWSILWEMATTLHSLAFTADGSGDIATEYRNRTGYEIALTETKLTNKDNKLSSLRKDDYEGKTIDITPHVKYGNREPKCLRVHFWLDNDHERIVIGHCGDHLDTSGSRRL